MERGQFSFDTSPIAAHYDETAPRLIPGYSAILTALPSLVGAAKAVLVVGCGTGAEIACLREAGRTIVGVDPAEAMIRVAEERFRGDRDVRLLLGDVSNLAPRDRFVAVTCLFVSHFIADKPAFWRSLATRLEPGGVLVCADFVRPSSEVEFLAMKETWFEHLAAEQIPENVIHNERRQFDAKFRLQTIDAYHGDLAEAGFSRVEVVQTWHWTHLMTARVS